MAKHASKAAMKHKDVPGSGAAKRRKIKDPKSKIATVQKEFQRGTLRSGSGAKVTNPKQSIAIALSEARRAGAKIKKPKKK